MMGISDALETTVSQLQWIYQISYCAFPTLFGLFMILWGIFLNGWDWTLIAVGTAVFLIFGWYTFKAFNQKKSD